MVITGVPGSFIKLDRSILFWRWYANANTFRVFVHLLLTANFAKSEFETVSILRGEAVTSYERLSRELGLSVGQVRTAIAHLKSTGELTVKRFPKFQVICIKNYDLYQGRLTRSFAHDGQSDGRAFAFERQHNNNTDNNIVREEKKQYSLPERAFKKNLGKYGNVLLTDAELELLKRDYGERAVRAIDFLDAYIEEDCERKSKYRIKNHDLVLRRWVFSAVAEKGVGHSPSDESRLCFSLDDVCEKP